MSGVISFPVRMIFICMWGWGLFPGGGFFGGCYKYWGWTSMVCESVLGWEPASWWELVLPPQNHSLISCLFPPLSGSLPSHSQYNLWREQLKLCLQRLTLAVGNTWGIRGANLGTSWQSWFRNPCSSAFLLGWRQLWVMDRGSLQSTCCGAFKNRLGFSCSEWQQKEICLSWAPCLQTWKPRAFQNHSQSGIAPTFLVVNQSQHVWQLQYRVLQKTLSFISCSASLHPLSSLQRGGNRSCSVFQQ